MRTSVRVILSAGIGLLVAAVVGGFALGADGSERGLQNLLWDVFTVPGSALLRLSRGGASPLFKQLVGGGGPGPAAVQMVLTSFLIWATLVAVFTFVCLRVKVTRTI